MPLTMNRSSVAELLKNETCAPHVEPGTLLSPGPASVSRRKEPVPFLKILYIFFHPVLSSGVSLRLNLFGYLVIEPYYAIPWQNGGLRNATFGINLLPGGN